MEAIEIVENRHIKRGGGRTLFFVTAHVKIVMIVAPIGEAMNQPGIAVIGEDDRLIDCEERVEVDVREAVRMLARRLNGHQIDDIYDANLYLREVLTQEVDGGQCFEGGNVPRACHHDI